MMTYQMKKLFLTGIAVLCLATGIANAREPCDTLHTSDTQCGNVCVRVFGNVPNRYVTFDGIDPYDKALRFKAGPTYKNASLNGCWLEDW
jgi:hypothetical protein